MEKTSPKAFDVLLRSTHDNLWNQGPFGEIFGTYAFAFLGSVCPHESVSMVDAEELAAPLPNEPSVSIDWNLVMSEDAQLLFFQRVKTMFDRTTMNLPAHQRKKYRLNGEELLKVRNMVVLFVQVYPHLKTRVVEDTAAAWWTDVGSNSHRDEDLQSLIQLRPPRFALSMLQSEQEVAKKDLLETEQKKVSDKEVQRMEVTTAQWNFFKGALERDQSKMATLKDAPRLMKQKLHAKQVAHRARQASQGETACKGYQDWPGVHYGNDIILQIPFSLVMLRVAFFCQLASNPWKSASQCRRPTCAPWRLTRWIWPWQKFLR